MQYKKCTSRTCVNRDKSKKFAEQATATVCLQVLGISDDRLSNSVPELPPNLSPGQQDLADEQSEERTETESTKLQSAVVEDTPMNQHSHVESVNRHTPVNSNSPKTTCAQKHGDFVHEQSVDMTCDTDQCVTIDSNSGSRTLPLVPMSVGPTYKCSVTDPNQPSAS